jgi:hypothetical protein
MSPGRRYLEKTFVHAACTLRKEIITSVWGKHCAGSLFYLHFASWFLSSANAVPWLLKIGLWHLQKPRHAVSLIVLALWLCACQLLYTWARIFKLLRSPRIDSKEPIPPGCVAWRAGTTTPIPTRLLAPIIDCLKIPALEQNWNTVLPASLTIGWHAGWA